MVVLIVLIGVGAGVVNNWMKLKHESSGSVEDAAELESLRAEVAALKRRVATLERLAIDKDTHLRDEISRLA
jgi:cell division protein FtsB